MSDRRAKIRNAYRQTGGHVSFYDGMMTYSTFLGKAICRVVWNMDGDLNYAYLERALSGVPEGFGGKLLEVPVCSCFYIRGGCARTDWFIKHLYQPKGFFTPPYETMESLRARLSTMYAEVDVTRYEGIACFRCRKVAL